MGVETYLYDFDESIYGSQITVQLHAFRRPEEKFENVEALRKQLALDIVAGREFEV